MTDKTPTPQPQIVYMQSPAKRKSPLIAASMLAAAIVAGGAAYYYREDIMAWLGLGGDDSGDDWDYTGATGFDCNVDGCDQGYECVEETGACKVVGNVGGTPFMIEVDAVNDWVEPNEVVWMYNNGQTMPLLNSVSGSYTLIENCPNCDCKHTVKCALYCITADGTTHEVWREAIFRSAGTYSFNAGPGLQNVVAVKMKIIDAKAPGAWLCFGWSDNDIDLASFQGTAMMMM